MNISERELHDKCGIASNGNTPPEILAVLATDEVAAVRCWIAYNRNTPVETLAVLATDKNHYVRYNVFYSPNATEEICLMVNAYEKYGHLVNCHTSSA